MTPAETFVKCAIDHKKDGHEWVIKKIGISKTAGWCAATMSAIGQECGYSNIIMPKRETSAGYFGYYVVTKFGGTYHKGGYKGGDDYTTNYIPQKGDLFFIQRKTKYGWGSVRTKDISPKKFQSTHVGVVDYVDSNKLVHTVEGNHLNTYCQRTLKLNQIAWYATPDWSKVKGKSGSTGVSIVPSTDDSTPVTKISPAEYFIQTAADHIKDGHEWVMQVTGIPKSYAWCAATMCAVGKTCKDSKGNTFSGIIMPRGEWGAAAFGKYVVETYGGKYIVGGKYGESATPKPGDLFEIQNPDGSGSAAASGLPAKYQSKHIGLVERVDDKFIYTIEGNHNGKYCRDKRSRSNIAWYARPDWSKISGLPEDAPDAPNDGSEGYEFDPNIYDSKSTRADATLREVGYFSSTGKPSISQTDTKLCVVNYTGLMADIVKMLSESNALIEQTHDDVSKMPILPKFVVEYLTNYMRVNTALAVGVAANIKWTSKYLFPVSTRKCIGIFGWPEDRGQIMQGGVGADWETDTSGQLDYLISELGTTFNSYLSVARNLENTEATATEFAETFRKFFGSKFSLSSNSVRSTAKDLWSNVKIVSDNSYSGVSPDGSTSGLRTSKSLTLVDKFKIGQDTIVYHGPDNIVKRAWDVVGQPSNYGVATINNYYVVTCPKSYGMIGDLIQFKYSSGYLNCVIASYSNTGKTSLRLKGVIDKQLPGYNKTVTAVYNYGRIV